VQYYWIQNIQGKYNKKTSIIKTDFNIWFLLIFLFCYIFFPSYDYQPTPNHKSPQIHYNYKYELDNVEINPCKIIIPTKESNIKLEVYDRGAGSSSNRWTIPSEQGEVSFIDFVDSKSTKSPKYC